MKTDKWLTTKNLEGSGRGLIKVISLNFEGLSKPTKTPIITVASSGIRDQRLPNTSLERYRHTSKFDAKWASFWGMRTHSRIDTLTYYGERMWNFNLHSQNTKKSPLLAHKNAHHRPCYKFLPCYFYYLKVVMAITRKATWKTTTWKQMLQVITDTGARYWYPINIKSSITQHQGNESTTRPVHSSSVIMSQ